MAAVKFELSPSHIRVVAETYLSPSHRLLRRKQSQVSLPQFLSHKKNFHVEKPVNNASQRSPGTAVRSGAPRQADPKFWLKQSVLGTAHFFGKKQTNN